MTAAASAGAKKKGFIDDSIDPNFTER
jgi:hypothetical protein